MFLCYTCDDFYDCHYNVEILKERKYYLKGSIKMTAKSIRRNLYKVLRKTGVPRNLIAEEAALKDELFVDDVDMTCFLYYLETNFQVNVKNDEIAQLVSVRSTIDYLQRHCA